MTEYFINEISYPVNDGKGSLVIDLGEFIIGDKIMELDQGDSEDNIIKFGPDRLREIFDKRDLTIREINKLKRELEGKTIDFPPEDDISLWKKILKQAI